MDQKKRARVAFAKVRVQVFGVDGGRYFLRAWGSELRHKPVANVGGTNKIRRRCELALRTNIHRFEHKHGQFYGRKFIWFRDEMGPAFRRPSSGVRSSLTDRRRADAQVGIGTGPSLLLSLQPESLSITNRGRLALHEIFPTSRFYAVNKNRRGCFF